MILSGAYVTEKHIASPGVWTWVLLHAIRLSTNQAKDNPLTRTIRNAIISNISTFHKIWKLLVLIILSEDKKQNYFYIYTLFYTVNCSAMLMHIKYWAVLFFNTLILLQLWIFFCVLRFTVCDENVEDWFTSSTTKNLTTFLGDMEQSLIETI